MIVREYVAAPGSRLSDEDASTVGQFIDARWEGRMAPAAEVVEAARPKRSPLHRFFEWDNDEAARRYREDQARLLVRSVWVIERVGEDKEAGTRAYHYVTEGEKSGYVPERIVWQRPDYADQVLDRAKEEFIAWKARYSQYVGLYEWAQEQLAA